MSAGPDKNCSIDSEDGQDSRLDAALRAAFGHPSTAYFSGGGDVLEEIRQATGVASHAVLLANPAVADHIVEPVRQAPSLPISSRYQIVGEIGRGGMGVVLRGRDPNLGRDIALKMLHDANAQNPLMIQRFVEEAQIGGQLQHPGILPIYDFGVDAQRRPYFTMRLVEGRTLASLLEAREDTAVDLMRLLRIFEQVCQTVGYAHARGVIHRDLKPANIMVGVHGEVQVVDWGLAKVIGRRTSTLSVQSSGDTLPALDPEVATVRSNDGSRQSLHGSIMGTPAYMSPEQARGEVDELAATTDVFSLGACLCEILTGAPPYAGTRDAVLEQAAACGTDQALVQLDACGVEPEMIQIVKRCLNAAPNARPPHAGVLAREIQAYFLSLSDRMHAAEIAVAESRATACAERRLRRRTTWLVAALAMATILGSSFAIRAERERTARVAQSMAEAAALYPKAIWFRAQADSVPAEFRPAWSEALGHVRRTAEVIRDGAVDKQLRDEVAEIVDQLEREQSEIDRRIERNTTP